MNKTQYKELQKIGQNILTKIEDFFVTEDNDYYGPNDFQRLDLHSVKFFYFTREYILEIQIKEEDNYWGYIVLKTPDDGREHTNLSNEYWIIRSIPIRFQAQTNAVVINNETTILSEELDIGELVKLICVNYSKY